MVLPSPSNDDQVVTDALVKPETSLLYAERSFTAHGQERGGVQTILRNPNTHPMPTADLTSQRLLLPS
ncbi:hypothetical protein QBC38DRAFT_134301 [Podospora fimiseda]|uniref:Uncharacterized protein n=1 Tax=Podospora fimiseda TaxID=252190 RepID=A0AAN7BET9_9PEZI|nr:hypothetical protein QBC38DRAFT_134301 [Podospora fimiseda]